MFEDYDTCMALGWEGERGSEVAKPASEAGKGVELPSNARCSAFGHGHQVQLWRILLQTDRGNCQLS